MMTIYSDTLHWSGITPIFDPITDLDLLPNLTFYLIARGFHGIFATGAACVQRKLTPPDTWSCPTLGLACVLLLRPISPELVLFPDFWISNILRYFCFCLATNKRKRLFECIGLIFFLFLIIVCCKILQYRKERFSPTGDRSMPNCHTSGEMVSHPKMSHPRQHFHVRFREFAYRTCRCNVKNWPYWKMTRPVIFQRWKWPLVSFKLLNYYWGHFSKFWSLFSTLKSDLFCWSHYIMQKRSKREVPRDIRNSKVRRQDKFRRDWSRH